MATCDRCMKETDKIFERDGLWLCRECYPKEVLKEDAARDFDPDNSETLADLLYDDFWSESDHIAFRRMEDD